MQITRTIEYDGIEIKAEFEYYEASRGAWEHGLQLTPDEPVTIELQDAFVGGQSIWNLLSPDQIEIIEDMLYGMNHGEG